MQAASLQAGTLHSDCRAALKGRAPAVMLPLLRHPHSTTMSIPSETEPLDAAGIRQREFPELSPGYLNAAAFTPLPLRSRRAVEEVHAQRADPASLSDADLIAMLGRARSAAAGLIGAEEAEVALAWNTSFGINLAARSLPLPAGSTIVVSDREFPTNVYPWMAAPGARLEVVPADALGRPDEARLFERLDQGDVSVLALSSVQFATGFRADIERFGEFCRDRGIFFVVDGIQSVGQVPVDVSRSHIDILAVGGQKWLCAPFGTGFVYVRRALLERLEPVLVGWTGMTASADMGSLTDYRWGLRDDARRFEVATLPFHDFAGFSASLELLREVGVGRIESHLRRLLRPVVEWLREADGVEMITPDEERHSAGILAFRTPAIESVAAGLKAAGITCGLREGAIRLAPHFYSVEADLAPVLEVLESYRARGWR